MYVQAKMQFIYLNCFFISNMHNALAAITLASFFAAALGRSRFFSQSAPPILDPDTVLGEAERFLSVEEAAVIKRKV